MSKKTSKSKVRYTKKDPDGNLCIDAKGYKALKEEETIFCYNKEEVNASSLEFFCSICNRNIRGLKPCENHWGNAKHKKQLHGHESKIKHIKDLHVPTLQKESLLTDLLVKTVHENAMSEDHVVERQNICREVEETIKESGVFDISCHLFGSSVTQVGYRDSNMNIDIHYDIDKISKVMPEITDVPLFLFHIHATIKKSKKFCDVADLFHMSTPRFTFTHVASGLKCIVCPYYKPGVKSSLLIKDIIDRDERAKILSLAFRNWAKICGVDDPSGGSLSPYCFTLLTIHYLQQVEPPVLPIINLHKQLFVPHGLRQRNDKNFINSDKIDFWKSENTSSIGKLWVGLFKFYLLDFFFKTHVVNITQHYPMVKQIRGLNGRRMSIEDPFFLKDNAANTLTSSEVMEYFYSCLEKSYRYFCGYDAIEKGEKKIESKPDPVKSAERKKRKEERKKERMQRRFERKQHKKEKKRKERELKKLNAEKAATTTSTSDTTTTTTSNEVSNESNDKNIESLDRLAKDIVADLIGDDDDDDDEVTTPVTTTAQMQQPAAPAAEDLTDSEDSESQESEEESDSDDEYVNGDYDLMNDLQLKKGEGAGEESSDIEIEEEYIEENGKLIRVDGEDMYEDDDDGVNKDSKASDGQSFNDKPLVNGEPGKQQQHQQQHDVATNSSNEETSSARHSSRDYDSQYEGDADDSQTEDDGKSVYVEGRLMEGLMTSSVDAGKKDNKTSHGKKSPDENLPDINKLVIDDSIKNKTFNNVKKRTESNSDKEHQQGGEENRKSSDVVFEPATATATSTTETKKEKSKSSSSSSRPRVDFSFVRKHLAPTRPAPLYCKSCNNEGHRRSECATLSVGNIPSLPPLSRELREMVDRLCEKILKDNALSEQEMVGRNRILQDMERHLQKFFNPACRLSLFGSSVNNFGFRGSDLDICLRFGSDAPPPGLDPSNMVVKVAKALDKHGDFHKVMYIKSAKVPIVKFVIKNLELDGDISLYNCLALNNSRMLKMYSLIDKRVRIIGYCAKVFAKVCEMGDASRGSLSSYAYTLLTLYYLQRCDPPVVPVLQDLYDHSKEKPQAIVEGWNTWYYDDIDNLPNVWPGYGKNKQSIGELWLGFLRFYVEKFDFARNVVAMKQLKTLSKFQKGWSHATMCIEDPFNLHHNLAAGISQNMFKYILGCFQNARVHFHTTHPHFRKNCAADFLVQYFFNRNHLTENKNVPKDRLCHRCGRIGHTAVNCAEKIVADRERRRLDSEKTYSSDNGDSDANQKPKGKGAMDHIQCYGCNQYGHRVANCPSKGGKSPAGKNGGRNRNRNRKDSDRAGFVQSNLAADNKSQQIVQTATELHPKENIELAIQLTGVVTTNSNRKPRTPKKDMRMKAGNISGATGGEIENSPFTISEANSLFNVPSPTTSNARKSLGEQMQGHDFSPEVSLAELSSLKASVDGVSFFRTTLAPSRSSSGGLQNEKPYTFPSGDVGGQQHHQQQSRRKTSPLKPTRRLGKSAHADDAVGGTRNEYQMFEKKIDFPIFDNNSPAKRTSGGGGIAMNNGWAAPGTTPPPGFQAISGEVKGNGNWMSNTNGFPSSTNQKTYSMFPPPSSSSFPSNQQQHSLDDVTDTRHGGGGSGLNNVQSSPIGFNFAQMMTSTTSSRGDGKFSKVSPNTSGLPPGFASPSGKFHFDDFAKNFQTANSPPESSSDFSSGNHSSSTANDGGCSSNSNTPSKRDSKRKGRKGKTQS